MKQAADAMSCLESTCWKHMEEILQQDSWPIRDTSKNNV